MSEIINMFKWRERYNLALDLTYLRAYFFREIIIFWRWPLRLPLGTYTHTYTLSLSLSFSLFLYVRECVKERESGSAKLTERVRDLWIWSALCHLWLLSGAVGRKIFMNTVWKLFLFWINFSLLQNTSDFELNRSVFN